MNTIEWITHCPQCGHSEIKIEESWLEIGIDGYRVYYAAVGCSNCGNITSILR